MNARRTALAVFLILFASLHARAASSLEDYRERVRRAADAVETLPLVEETDTRAGYQARTARTIQSVRTLLPVTETVSLNGAEVSVDNSWLDTALNNYAKLLIDDPRRDEEAARMVERLRAIEEHVSELLGSHEGAKRQTKEEAKAKLASILSRAEYQERTQQQQSALARLWQRFVNWLRGLFPEQKPLPEGTSAAARGVSLLSQIIIIAVALAIIAFVAWKLAPRFFRNRKKIVSEATGARVILGERIEPDQSAADLWSQAESLARSGDLRGAIRKGYIALLCNLGDRKIIGLADHKTNNDYLRAIRQRPNLYQPMRQLTNIFEQHWYGLAQADENDWTEFRGNYKAVTSEK